ncbi:acyltransferase family protein [Arthrobacter sp. ZGTC131]|uniref:acyltransferase family protein n=1 Tax=Arthrobacter sp. ZGTC131 TaxID=2058898 RepID=UPI0021571756|nr:acyltransferase family protein [Arthrobacter sp. ZGTC131]
MSPTNLVTDPAPGLREAKNRPVPALFRPEIQGLRAIAVAAVVLYHFWPRQLSGGYVGVDVFFVISGYLITSHMYREIVRTSSVGLLKFWARRVRRLLPASFLVLFASLAGVLLWVPSTVWEVSARQLAASAFYVQNWVLANDSVDYSAQHNDATVAQHYWSLSVEEQFYVVWPLLVLGLLYLTPKLARSKGPASAALSPRSILIGGPAVIGAASLAYSMAVTAMAPSMAYFVTPARVWEFAAGALVALVFLERTLDGWMATVLGWAGIGLIVGSSVMFTAETPFPGWTALVPVGGTVLLLMVSGTGTPAGSRWWLSSRGMTFVGGISYSLYLWHWPVLIVAPYVLGRPAGLLDKCLLLALVVVLSWLTKITVEDPMRTGRFLSTPRRAYLFAASGMAMVLVLSVALTTLAFAGSDGQSAQVNSPCYGPGALDPANHCNSVTGEGLPDPAPAVVARQNTEPLYKGCQGDFSGTELVSCDFGVEESQATATVALVGDSHATAWLPAIEVLAERHKWHVKTYTKGSCPLTAALRVLPSEATDRNQSDCWAWGKKLQEKLAADKEVSTVFTAAYSSAYTYKSAPGVELRDPAVEGFTTVWKGLLASGKRVVAFDDVPRTNGQYVPTCLAANNGDPLACATTVDKAFPKGTAITHAAASLKAPGFTRIPLRSEFCDAKLCYPQLGAVIVYRDYSHISAEYSRALAPFVDRQLS